jgi:hypothetical protein
VDILRDLLTAMLVIVLAVSVTFAILLLSSSEHESPALAVDDIRCTPPEGWGAHLVQAGENLTVLAEIVGLEPAELVIANCLQGDVHPGDTLFLPPARSEAEACGPPAGWRLYELKPEDTLPGLAGRFAISEAALWHANCMSESMTYSPGFRIYVPSSTATP